MVPEDIVGEGPLNLAVKHSSVIFPKTVNVMKQLYRSEMAYTCLDHS